MTDFFISYTGVDQTWAEWIGYVLEEQGFSVVIQAWDFKPGANFVLEMQKAADQALRTIMVLSPAYLNSIFVQPEWAAAFVADPKGLSHKLVPVMVERCEPTGLLKAIVQIRITGMNEATASSTLMAGLSAGRAKPVNRPAFPGGTISVAHKMFPGPVSNLIERVKSGASVSAYGGLQKILSVMQDIAVDAGNMIVKEYRANLPADTKPDGSIVTEVDRKADKYIRDRLHSKFPDIIIISEESLDRPDVSGGTFFLVDPIDGSREFQRNRSHYTVNVALIVEFCPVLGVIYIPEAQELYIGGHGSAMKFELSEGTLHSMGKISVSNSDRNFRIVTSRLRGNTPELNQFRTSFPSGKFHTVGSSVKFCHVADGQHDIYPSFGDTREWDTAAGHAIVNAAGGQIITLDGDLRYGKAKFQNPYFIVYGGTDVGIIEMLRDKLREFS